MISKILHYYALLSLTTLPLTVLLFIYLYKKTSTIETINRWIDRLLGVEEKINKTPQPETAPDTDKKEEGKPEEKEEDLTRPENSQISAFKLPVGDEYHCKSTRMDRSSRLMDLQWFSKNKFLGTTNEKGIFKAVRAGKVELYYRRANDPGDLYGTMAYEIDIMPKNPAWFGGELIPALEERMKKDKVLAKLIDLPITSEVPSAKVISFAGNGEYSKLSIQFDQYKELERIVYQLKNSVKTDDIVKELDERFEETKLETGEGIRLWTRRYEPDEEDIEDVRLYAFLRELPTGERFLGIGQFWREYGDLEEFQLNIALAEKSFGDLLPGITPAKVKAVVEEKRKPEKPAETAQAGKPFPVILPANKEEAVTSATENTEQPASVPEDPAPESGSKPVPDDLPDPDDDNYDREEDVSVDTKDNPTETEGDNTDEETENETGAQDGDLDPEENDGDGKDYNDYDNYVEDY